MRWKTAKAYGHWVIVRADPRVKKTAGGLILTETLTQVERKMEGTGRLLSLGSRAREVAGDVLLEAGARIAFRGFLKDMHKIGKAEEDCDVFVLHAKDVLMVIEDDVRMGAFS